MDLRQLRAQRDAILAIDAKHGATNVRVFGPVARNEATDTSDVDFLVDLFPRHYRSRWPIGLIIDLENLLGRPINVGKPKQLHWVIQDRVLRKPCPCKNRGRPPALPGGRRGGCDPVMRISALRRGLGDHRGTSVPSACLTKNPLSGRGQW